MRKKLKTGLSGGKPAPFIRTVAGRATYSHTEFEDKYGNWNDRWESVRGEWVIHDGKKHHVYIINFTNSPKICSNCGSYMRTESDGIHQSHTYCPSCGDW